VSNPCVLTDLHLRCCVVLLHCCRSRRRRRHRRRRRRRCRRSRCCCHCRCHCCCHCRRHCRRRHRRRRCCESCDCCPFFMVTPLWTHSADSSTSTADSSALQVFPTHCQARLLVHIPQEYVEKEGERCNLQKGTLTYCVTCLTEWWRCATESVHVSTL